MNQGDIDLCAWREGEEHKMMAVAKLADGTLWNGQATAYKGAGKPIAAELAARFPERFSDVKEAEMWFMFTHARLMHNKQNSAGQAYPG